MSLLTTAHVRERAKKEATRYTFSMDSLLESKMAKQASVSSYDIFLSHAFSDKDLILGIALTLEDLGYSVYLDWRNDPDLDRNSVTPATAQKLRERMRSSNCLFFATERSSNSKWMPWELGYKDGHNTHSAILPLREGESNSFTGQEYLGIYPYVNQAKSKNGQEKLWIHDAPDSYIVFDDWLKGKEPHKRS